MIFVALCIWFLSCHSSSSALPCTDPVEQLVQKNDFFGKNEQSILHIGIKSWARGTKRVIEKHWAFGDEMAIGPFIEWHPLNGIGLQTGLFYSYNFFLTVDFSVDRKRVLDASVLAFGCRVINEINTLSAKDEGYITDFGLYHMQFHAINLPLLFRLYPEKSRKFICYVGPRLILIFPGLEKKEYCSLHVDSSVIKNILYDGLKRGKDIADQRDLAIQDIKGIVKDGFLKASDSFFQINPDRAQNQTINNQLFNWDLVWDFGFEFRGSVGIVIGINGLGLVLGYDYAK